MAENGPPAFFIIDEIFRGTNHLESISAAAAVLHTLAASGLVIVSSHNLVLAPLLVSVVVRAFGWSMLLGPEGLVNGLFGLLGFGPVKMLYTEIAVVIALVHVMLPFMVIPVWTSLQKLDPGVENAALSLKASPFTTLRRIVLPQVLPGILSGSLIVFGLAASSFAIPGLLGGRRLKMVATVVYDEYLHELNWPLGAAIALTLLVANLIVMLSYNRLVEGRYKKSLG